jgi:Transposase DDE domain
MLVCLVLDASCVGVFSSRKSVQAWERTLAFRAIVGADRPDCRTLSDCRTRHLAAFGDVCVEVLRLAGESGVVKLGHVATDGTTRQGHASRHTAMSSGSMQKEVERIREEMEAWVTQASPQEAEDEAALGSRRGDAWPAAWARQDDRLATREAAMQRREARATAEAEAERPRRAAAEAARQRTDTKRRGRAPQEVDETPEDQAQMRCTDPALPRMQRHNTGWDYGGHAQGSGEEAYQILVACDVIVEANDQQPAAPMAQWTVAHVEQAGSERPTAAAGVGQKISGTCDRGSDSEAAAKAVEPRGFEPSLAPGRQRHPVLETEAAEAPTTATARLAAKVRAPQGRTLSARRTVSVEPVCGQRKEARGFRRCLLRGLAKIRGAWCLVCLTHNLRKIWRYTYAPLTVEADKRALDVSKMVCFRTPISRARTVSRRNRPNFSGKHTPFAWTVALTGDQ